MNAGGSNAKLQEQGQNKYICNINIHIIVKIKGKKRIAVLLAVAEMLFAVWNAIQVLK